MEHATMKLHRDHRLPGPFASPWLVIGGAVILGVIILVMTLRNLDRDGEQMATILEEKGASLIKALEAGARTGMRNRAGTDIRMQVLVEEMADQPDILFIMVTDHNGRVLAHSEPDIQGEVVFSPEDMSQLQADNSVNWRIMAKEDIRAFVVYRQFTPLQGREGWWNRIHRQMDAAPADRHAPPCPEAGTGSTGTEDDTDASCLPPDSPFPEHGAGAADSGTQPWQTGHMRRMGRMRHDGHNLMNFFTRPDGPPPIIYVGMDVTPFERAREADTRHTVVMAGILLLLGLAGFISLIWAQNVRRSRRMLQDSQAFAAEIIASLPEGLVLVDAEGTIALINDRAEEQLGLTLDAVRGRRPEEVLPRSVLEALHTVARKGRMEETEAECHIGDGQCIPMSISGARVVADDVQASRASGATTTPSGEQPPHHVADILIMRDLREVRRLQQEVRRKEKLAAVGSLAAGVAHEIRNPLSSIKGYATYFGTRFPEGSEDRAAAGIMVQEVDRLNRVITDLIGLSRPSDIKRTPTDMQELAEHCLRLLRQDAATQHIALALECDSPLPPVGLDPDRFSQALLNICLNGMEAMQQGGTLTLALDRQADMVRLRIRDTGHGITDEHMGRIFDPYYTTKSQGTGLGLSIVQKIIESHGGTVTVTSSTDDADHGTTFTILLPVSQPEQD